MIKCHLDGELADVIQSTQYFDGENILCPKTDHVSENYPTSGSTFTRTPLMWLNPKTFANTKTKTVLVLNFAESSKELNALDQNFTMNFGISSLGFFDVSDSSHPKEMEPRNIKISPTNINDENGEKVTTTDVSLLLEKTLQVLNSRKDRRDNKNSALISLEMQFKNNLVEQGVYESRKKALQKASVGARAPVIIDIVNTWAKANVQLIFFHAGPKDTCGLMREYFMFEQIIPRGLKVGDRTITTPTPVYQLLDKGRLKVNKKNTYAG